MRKGECHQAWPAWKETQTFLYLLLWTQLTYWDCCQSNTMKSSDWNFQHEFHAEQHGVSKFLEEWIASWHFFPYKQCPSDSNLLYSRKKLKQSLCATLIIQNGNNSPIASYIYIMSIPKFLFFPCKKYFSTVYSISINIHRVLLMQIL